MSVGSGNGPKTRLELTWIGKDERPRLEPRILLPQANFSHAKGSPADGGIYDNILIQGDNLLALKALEKEFAGKVQCIYIDPPFNTKQAFESYDDGLEHSYWLTLMRDRIEALHRLLSDTGSFLVHIDDNELGYLMALMDEIFGRKNRIALITFKQSSVSGPKAINPGVVTTGNYIVLYSKDKERWKNFRVYQKTGRDDRYSKFVENKQDAYSSWRLIPLRQAFCADVGLSWDQARARFAERLELRIEQFVLSNADRVVRTARVLPRDVNEEARAVLARSVLHPDMVFRSERANRDDYYFLNGEQLLFYQTKVRREGGAAYTAVPASNIWDDLLSNNLHAEGGVAFPNGKKPELLLKRIIDMTTEPGDVVLDSFAGSGTTGAVAHKMSRRWIMVELGEHAVTHIVPRLRKVVDGEDSGGATVPANWQGGGGYRFYRLAPSLIEEDQYGQKVISRQYNSAMLAQAMCKHMGFTYAPSQDPALYWQQGHATERDFIYVTTQSLTYDALMALSMEVGPERTLLVCCKAFRARLSDFPNLTVKKIPQAVLENCEWGRDDYSLNIAKPTDDDAQGGGDDPDDGGGDGGDQPAAPRRARRSTAATSAEQVQAAPLRKAPLRMDGTRRKPRAPKAPAESPVPPAPAAVALSGKHVNGDAHATPAKSPKRKSTTKAAPKPAPLAPALLPPAAKFNGHSSGGEAKTAVSKAKGKKASPNGGAAKKANGQARAKKTAASPRRRRKQTDEKQGELL